jgi:hypothetical protein
MWHIYVRDGERFVYHSSEDGRRANRQEWFPGAPGRHLGGTPENVRVSRTAPPSSL